MQVILTAVLAILICAFFILLYLPRVRYNDFVYHLNLVCLIMRRDVFLTLYIVVIHATEQSKVRVGLLRTLPDLRLICHASGTPLIIGEQPLQVLWLMREALIQVATGRRLLPIFILHTSYPWP